MRTVRGTRSYSLSSSWRHSSSYMAPYVSFNQSTYHTSSLTLADKGRGGERDNKGSRDNKQQQQQQNQNQNQPQNQSRARQTSPGSSQQTPGEYFPSTPQMVTTSNQSGAGPIEAQLSPSKAKSRLSQLDPTVLSSLKKVKNSDEALSRAKSQTRAFIPADKAQRFAKDLFLAAVQYDGALEAVLSDLDALSQKVKSDPQFNQLFKNPLTPANVRRAALRDYLKNTKLQSPLSTNAMQILSNIRALPLIGNVSAALRSMYDLLHKRLDVVVTTAVDNEEERKKVADDLKRRIGNQAQLSFVWKTDPSLISGMRAEVRGSTLFDNSGRKGLEEEANAYLSRLDTELTRLKSEKSHRFNAPISPDKLSTYSWDRLLSEVTRMDVANNTQQRKGAAQAGASVGAAVGTAGVGEEEGTERMRLLDEIYNFKRANETKTQTAKTQDGSAKEQQRQQHVA